MVTDAVPYSCHTPVMTLDSLQSLIQDQQSCFVEIASMRSRISVTYTL